VIAAQQACHDADSPKFQALQKQLIETDTAQRLAEVFKALGDPTRIKIISLLLENEVCVHDLEAITGASQSAVSHQLRVLRQLKLVRFRKEGRHVYYALDDEHVHELIKHGLEHVRHE
jgi:DNA-binding transcriptional ArsR family regulator